MDRASDKQRNERMEAGNECGGEGRGGGGCPGLAGWWRRISESGKIVVGGECSCLERRRGGGAWVGVGVGGGRRSVPTVFTIGIKAERGTLGGLKSSRNSP